MKSTRYTFGLVLLLVFACTVSSCRPRATRNRQPQTQTQQTPQSSGTPSAAQVMARTDSVIARIGEMSEESDIPVAYEEEDATPRTPWGTPYVPKPENDDYSVYESALGAFNGGNYDQAIGLFSQMVVAGRPPELIPNAYYWMGESYFAMERYQETLPYFEHTVKVGPQHKREIAMYKLAKANHELGNQQAASLWYQRLRAEYPKTSYASRLRKLGIS